MYSSDELFRTRLQCRTASSWGYPKALSPKAAECPSEQPDHERSFFKIWINQSIFLILCMKVVWQSNEKQ